MALELQGAFYVQDNKSTNLLVIDKYGRMAVRENLILSSTLPTDGFVLKNALNQSIFAVNLTGSLYLPAGSSIYERQQAISLGTGEFVIQNSAHETIAKINSQGIYLRGNYALHQDWI